MKKLSKLSGTVLSLLLAAGLTACGGDKGNGNGNGGDPEKPWDKTRTAKVLVVSNLSEGSLFTDTNYQAVVSGVQSADCHAALLDRTNSVRTQSGAVNPGANVALKAGKIPLFVPIAVAAQGYVGSTVLLDKPLNSLEQIRATDHCWLMKHDVNISTSVKMRFATISFTDESQLAAGVTAIKNMWSLQTLFVGVVKKSLAGTFENAVTEAVMADHMFVFADDGADDYRVYVLGSAKWKLRETDASVLSGNIESFLIQVEYLK